MRVQVVLIVEGATEEEIANTRATNRWRELGDPDLAGWWIKTAVDDLHAALPKVEEYGGSQQGSADLEVMGDALAVFSGWGRNASSPVLQEMACWFYVLGKVARLITDYRAGRPGKADTWHDASVYCMMARRLQECGRWP